MCQVTLFVHMLAEHSECVSWAYLSPPLSRGITFDLDIYCVIVFGTSPANAQTLMRVFAQEARKVKALFAALGEGLWWQARC